MIFIEEAVRRFAVFNGIETGALTVLYPDAGAQSRYKSETFLSKLNYTTTHATKVRNTATGQLLSFDVSEVPVDRPLLIVDDICDGGGTFIGIARALRGRGMTLPLSLYVTHGIFSKGLSSLRSEFTQIYTTNSYLRIPSVESPHVMDADLVLSLSA